MPTPDSAAVCVPLAALSVSVNAPVRIPPAVGANTINSVQAAFGASAAPQVVEARWKSPLTAMLEIVSVTPPLLVSVIVCVGEVSPRPTAPNTSPADGVSDTPAGATPLPESATVCERNWSLTVSAPSAAPVVAGTNATLMAHVECAVSEVPQPLVAVNGPPEMLALTSVSAISPELVSNTCCVALDVPICCAANVSACGASESVAGALPVPVSEAVCVPASSVTASVPLRAPLAVGANATGSEQPVCAASVVPQVFAVSWKSPVSTGADSAVGVPPVFDTVIVCAAEVWPTMVAANVSEGGVSTIAAGAVPVPVSVAVACPPSTLA